MLFLYISFDFDRGWRRSSGGRASDSYSLGPGFESLRRYHKIMILTKFVSNLKDRCFLSRKDSLLIACSGGPDSIFMLHLFYEFFKKEGNFFKNIAVLHINHNFRNTSKRDELFVKKISEKMGFDIFVENIYPPSENLNLEEFFREERIKIFKKYISEEGFSKIALGHTADDLIENFFLRIVRGTGLHGLVDMDFVGWDGNVIRPILNFYKDEIENYLVKNGIEYVFDETNALNDFKRNKIRNVLLPFILKNIDKDFRKKVVRLVEVLRLEDKFNKRCSKKLFNSIATFDGKDVLFDVSKFGSLSFDEKVSFLREIVFFFQGNFRKIYFKNYIELVEFIEEGKSGRMKKAGSSGIIFIKEFDKIRVLGEIFDKGKSFKGERLEVIPPCEIEFFGEKYEITVVDLNKIIKNKNCYLYPASLSDKIIFRKRKRVDILRFKFGNKKLKKFFIEKKVLFSKRDDVVVVCDSDDKIIWIPELNYRFELFNDNMYSKFFCMERKI